MLEPTPIKDGRRNVKKMLEKLLRLLGLLKAKKKVEWNPAPDFNRITPPTPPVKEAKVNKNGMLASGQKIRATDETLYEVGRHGEWRKVRPKKALIQKHQKKFEQALTDRLRSHKIEGLVAAPLESSTSQPIGE